MGVEGRLAAGARNHGPLPRRDALPDPARARRRPATGCSAAGIALTGASDHGVSEALYVRDPDGNGVELYWDRPAEQWPRDAEDPKRVAMFSAPLDITDLLAELDRA